MIIKMLQIFSGSSHIIYGITALVVPYFKEEFTRYGFQDFRILIALIQILAGFGMFLGLYRIRITQYSSAILSVMMIGALITRIVIQDDLIQSSPAFVYMSINSIIFLKSIKTRI